MKHMICIVLVLLLRGLDAQDYPVTDSAECLLDCLDKSGIFCQEYSWVSPGARGACCELGDQRCIDRRDNGLCSSEIILEPMKAFACPYDYQVCGSSTQQIILAADGESTVIETKTSFQTDKICSYEVSAPETAQNGDLIYLRIDRLAGASVYAAIAPSLTEGATALCWIQGGQAILARHPDSIFVRFLAESQYARVAISSYYSKYVREDAVVSNFAVCSDSGNNLADLRNPDGTWIIQPASGGITDVDDSADQTEEGDDTDDDVTEPLPGDQEDRLQSIDEYFNVQVIYAFDQASFNTRKQLVIYSEA